MKVLLDSNAYAQLMRGREQISRIVRGAEEVLLSAVVLAELLYGFRHVDGIAWVPLRAEHRPAG